MKSIVIAVFVLPLLAFSQSTCPCCTPAHRQFDFWIGEWIVTDTTGKEVGRNKLVLIQDSCALQENWISGKTTGTSYNYYNQTDSTWNQLWIDNSGSVLNLKGGLVNGKMVLKSAMIPGKRVKYYYNRITWEKNKDGSVTQTWDVLSDSNKLLQQAFKGIYKKI